jgi:hypothetical protein
MANFVIDQPNQTAIGTDDADSFTFVGAPNNNVSGAGGADSFLGAINTSVVYGDAGDDAFNHGAIFPAVCLAATEMTCCLF